MSYWTENDDKLGRAEESAYIIRFLTQQVSNRVARGKTGSYVLNIDATWGEGKTFFMKGLFSDLAQTGHPVIMVDAWRDDFSNDPLTAVFAEFDNFLNSFKSSDRSIKTKVKTAGKDLRRNVGKLSLLTAKGIAKRATTYVVGEAADEVVQTANESQVMLKRLWTTPQVLFSSSLMRRSTNLLKPSLKSTTKRRPVSIIFR